MIEHVLDKTLVRVLCGALLGIPLTAVALLGLVYGVTFLVVGLQQGKYMPAGLGVLSILGILGVAGAWRRLLRRHVMMTARERLVVRRLILCGVVASATLAVATSMLGGSGVVIAFFTVLTVGGAALVRGTPTSL